mgnify:CR=1 FL=1
MVARAASARLVRKNAYKIRPASTMVQNAQTSTAASRVLTSQPSTFTPAVPPSRRVASLSASVTSVVVDNSGTLLFPITCRFTE